MSGADCGTWCKEDTRQAILEWLKNTLPGDAINVRKISDLRDGLVLYRLLQHVQDQSLETVAARRTMIARPTLRFAKINAFIQSAMKISSIYGLNVDAITHSGSEQELCKAAVLLLFLGSLTPDSQVLKAGVTLSASHQVALQEVLKVIQNYPEPAVTVEDANPPTSGASSTPTSRTASTSASAAGIHSSRLASMSSVSSADSPLLAQLLESPINTASKQKLYSQVRKLKLQVLTLQDERDMVQEDKQRETNEMKTEINELKVQLTNLQETLASCYSDDEYRILEVELTSLRPLREVLDQRTADLEELNQRLQSLNDITESDGQAIAELKQQNQQLTEECSKLDEILADKQGRLTALNTEVEELQLELSHTRDYLAGKECELTALKQSSASFTSKPGTPVRPCGENMGEILLSEAQQELSSKCDELRRLTASYDTLTERCHSLTQLEHTLKEAAKDMELTISRLQRDVEEERGKRAALEEDHCRKTSQHQETVSDLQTKVSKLSAERSRFEDALCREKKCREELADELGESRRQNDQRTQQTEQLVKKVDDLQTELTERQAVVKELESSVSQLNPEVERLNAAIAEYSAKLDDLEKRKLEGEQTAERSSQELQLVVESLQSQNSALVQNFESVQSRLTASGDALQQQMSLLEEMKSGYESRLTLVNSDLHAAQTEIELLQQAAAKERRVKDDVQAQYEASIAELHDRNAEIRSLVPQVEERRVALEAARQQFSEEDKQLRAEISELTNQLEAVRAHSKDLQQKLDREVASGLSLEECLRLNEEAVSVRDSEIEKLSERISSNEDSYNKAIESANRSLTDALAEYAAERACLTDKIQKLHEEKNGMSGEITTLQQSVDEKQQTLSDQKNELEKLMASIDKVKAQADIRVRGMEDVMQSTNAEMEASIKQLQAQLEQEKGSTADVCRRLGEQDQAFDVLKTEYEQLMGDRKSSETAYRDEIEELQATIVEKGEEIKSQMERAAELQSKVLSLSETVTAQSAHVKCLELENGQLIEGRGMLTNDLETAQAELGAKAEVIAKLEQELENKISQNVQLQCENTELGSGLDTRDKERLLVDDRHEKERLSYAGSIKELGGRISALEQEKTTLEDELKALSDQLADERKAHEDRLYDLRNEADRLKEEGADSISNFKNALNQKEERISQLSEEQLSLQHEVEELNKQVDLLMTTNQQLSTELSKEAESVSHLTEELNRSEAKSSDLESAIERLEAENKQIKGELEDQKSEVQATEETWLDRGRQLQHTIDVMELEKDELMKRQTVLETTIQEQEVRKSELEQAVEGCQQEIERLSDIKLSVESNLDSVTNDLDSVTTERDSVSKQCADLTSQLCQLTGASNVLTDLNEQMSKEIESLKEATELSTRDLSETTAQVATLKEEKHSLQASLEETKALLKEEAELNVFLKMSAANDGSKAAEQVAQLSDSNCELMSSNTQLASEVEQLKATVAELEVSLDESNSCIAILHNDKLSLQQRLKSEADKLTSDNRTLAETKSNLEQQVSAFIQSIAELKEENCKLLENLEGSKTTYDKISQTLAERMNEIEELKLHREQLENEREQIRSKMAVEKEKMLENEVLLQQEQQRTVDHSEVEAERDTLMETVSELQRREQQLIHDLDQRKVEDLKHQETFDCKTVEMAEEIATLTSAKAESSDQLEQLKSKLSAREKQLHSTKAELAKSNEFLDRYKVYYKEKKVKIANLEHELKVSRALCEKYKGDLDGFISVAVPQADKTANDQESDLKLADLDTTARTGSGDLNEIERRASRRRSFMGSKRPATNNATFGIAMQTYGDDEADVLMDSTLKPNSEYQSDLMSVALESGLLSEDRIDEMKRRNAQCLPHLKTAYPIETQTYDISKARDDDIRESRLTSENQPPVGSDETSPPSDASSRALPGFAFVDTPEGNRLSVRLPPDTIPKGSVWIPGKYDHLIDPKQAHKRALQPIPSNTPPKPDKSARTDYQSTKENVKMEQASAAIPARLKSAEAFIIANTPKSKKKAGLKSKIKEALGAKK